MMELLPGFSTLAVWIDASQASLLLATACSILICLFGWFLYRLLRINMMLKAADQYRLTAEASGGACFEFDCLSRRLDWVDEVRLQLLGFPAGHYIQIGRDYERVHPDDRTSLRQAWDGFSEGRKADMQLRLQMPGESWAWFHLSAIPIKNHKNQFTRAIGVFRSTNALHEMQQRLAEDRRMETIGTIAGGIAHEFNNHLTPVRGYIELTMDDLGSEHPSYEGLYTALDRVIYCSELVAQIQAYGRKSLLVMRPVNLAELLPGALASAAAKHQVIDGQVTIEDGWPATLPMALVDKSQFAQAMSNLVQNALQAMPDGGTLRVEADAVEITEDDCRNNRDAKPGYFVAVRLRDTGFGIAAEHLSRVMEPFYTTHGRARAQGMGLAMVHGMMAQHAGWMDIQTVPNGGTVVSLYFPVDPASLPETATREASGDTGIRGETESGVPHLAPGRLLAADDETFIRRLIRRLFEKKGWEVDDAQSHDEVVEIFTKSETHYDLVVLDLTMPGGTIEQTTATILNRSPTTKILLSSGRHKDSRVERLTDSPRVDFIPKPYAMKDLMAKVDGILSVTTS